MGGRHRTTESQARASLIDDTVQFSSTNFALQPVPTSAVVGAGVETILKFASVVDNFTEDSVTLEMGGVAGSPVNWVSGSSAVITLITTHGAIPEPGELALFTLGVLGLIGGYVRRRRLS